MDEGAAKTELTAGSSGQVEDSPSGQVEDSPSGQVEDFLFGQVEDSLIGQTLDGRYEVRRSLDQGGMATVYLAFDQQLQREVVVKIPHARLMVDRTFRQRFLQEIRDLATHEHSAIVRIEAWGEHDDVPYAIMQYLSGGNLRERIAEQGGQQTQAQVMQWLPQIAGALDFVHGRGSLHRDVKPANILFDEQGHPILSDFGIATAMGAADPDAPTQEVRRDLTVVGTFVGSPAYAPPEAIDRLLTPAYDQYSLATVVYFAMSGELPFTGQTNEAILIAKETKSPPKIDAKKLKGRFSRQAEKAIMKALSRAPADRYSTCQEFVEAFAADTAAPGIGKLPWLAISAIGASLVLAVLLGPRAWQFVNSMRSASTNATAPQSGLSVVLGSHPEEIDRAIFLCKSGGGVGDECARTVFSDERLREATFTTPFSLDPTEITNTEFRAFAEAADYETTAESRGYSWDITKCIGCSWRQVQRNRRRVGQLQNPVVHVSWADARAYCQWRGARLPSEDEWEFTARGKERRTFPWGEEWDPSRVRVSTGGAIGLEPVGSRPQGATPEGIQDMAGSVSEWTSTGTVPGEERIVKGGSWSDRIPAYFRAAAFSVQEPDYSSISIGFRCARDD
ncbi:MAG: SUMF1/EgtB/PvdO family nonheme iron enzyme [Deltaproteobacteria bacterium]|nr:SUMF1/EgtB/PvdO family nonheme iron enzyme [Deltaproteobacteria bacterium]